MDNIQSNSSYNQPNPNNPPQTPAHPPQGAPTLHPQALSWPFMQLQGFPPLSPAPGFPPHPPMAQLVIPPAFLNQPPQLGSGPKRTTPESGLEPRPDDEIKRGRTTPSTSAAPLQPFASHPAGSFPLAPSSHFHPGASFLYPQGWTMHDGQGMGSASMSQTGMPDITPQILEAEKSRSKRRISDLPGVMRKRVEGSPIDAVPALHDAVCTKNEAMFLVHLAQPNVEIDKRDVHGCTVLHYAAALGMTRLVEALGKMGIDPDVRDNAGRSALHYAVLAGYAATTVALLKVPNIDINLDIKDKTGETALMLAVDRADAAIVDALLAETKINFNVRDKGGYTPLLRALANISTNVEKYQAIVDALLNRTGIDVRACNSIGTNALILATQSDAPAVVRRLLGMKRIDVNARNEEGETPLMIASHRGNETIMRDLLDTPGIAINARDEERNTALMKAAKAGRMNATRMLLKTPGVNINAKNKEGETAFTLAVKKGRSVVAALLFASAESNVAAANGSNNVALALAAASGDIAAVRDLLAKPDTDVNACAAGNFTPLMLAAANGHEAVVQALRRAPGIKINYRGIYSSSALMLAAKNGHTAIVESLLDTNGIEINAGNEFGQTALMLAAAAGHESIVKALLARPNIDVNIEDIDGVSAIALAVRGGHPTIIKLLLVTPTIDVGIVVQKAFQRAASRKSETIRQLLLTFPGIAINAASPFARRTALIKAASRGDATATRSLLAMPDIDVNAQNEEDKTALMLAAEQGNDSIIRALLAMPDIRLDLKDNKGRTALELAIQAANDTIIDALQSHVLPSSSSSAHLQETLQTLFASANSISDISAGDASKLDAICERLENGKYAAAEIPALFPSVALMGGAATEAFARSLAFGFCTGHFRNADGGLDDTIGIIINTPWLRQLYDATVSKISAAASDIDLHRVARSNLLGIAAREGNVRMMRGLGHLGANVNLPSPNGKTALAVAVERKDWAACAELVSLGALPTLPLHDGYPALYHIVEAFGSDDDTSESAALLIRYLRIKGIPFDILVKNPDKTMRATRPVVLLNDLLASKVQSWGKFAHLVYGFERTAPAASAAPGSTADTSSSLSDTSRNVGAAPRNKDD